MAPFSHRTSRRHHLLLLHTHLTNAVLGDKNHSAYIFPGVALGILETGARRVTDKHMLIAAKTLASTLTPQELDQGRVYPPLETIRKVSAKIAAAVGEDVYRTNLASFYPMPTDMMDFMIKKQYDVSYPVYTAANTCTHLVIDTK